jgi:CobQ-like glutamine amidotransferase family enzyme
VLVDAVQKDLSGKYLDFSTVPRNSSLAVAILQTALRIKLLLIVYRSLIANPPFSFG